MKQTSVRNAGLLFFAIVLAFSDRVSAQEFKGFYNNASLPVQRSQRRFLDRDTRRYDYPAQSGAFINYDGSSDYYSSGFYAMPFRGFYGNAITPGDIVINVLPAGLPPSAGTSNYNYYNGTDFRRNSTGNVQFTNRVGDDGYRQLPVNGGRIKINGNWFYEMNGNYYRADYVDNAGRSNAAANSRGGNNYFSLEEGSVKGNNVFLPSQARNDNANYTNVVRPATKAAYADNDSENGNAEYLYRRQADNLLIMSQQEQQALKAENAGLKQQLQQKDAAEKAAMKAEADMYSNLKEGDTVDRIPRNSKEVTIDGKKTYLSPGNTFYRKENGKFRVVGKQ